MVINYQYNKWKCFIVNISLIEKARNFANFFNFKYVLFYEKDFIQLNSGVIPSVKFQLVERFYKLNSLVDCTIIITFW